MQRIGQIKVLPRGRVVRKISRPKAVKEIRPPRYRYELR